MGTYREAIQHARAGGTARRAGKEIRFLTFEEAEPIIIERCPSRRTRMGDNGKPVIEAGEIVVDTYASTTFDVKRLGLYDVGVHPAEPFAPTDEDIYEPVELDDEGNTKPRALRGDWATGEEAPVPAPEPEPEVIAPETVDEALAETILAAPPVPDLDLPPAPIAPDGEPLTETTVDARPPVETTDGLEPADEDEGEYL